MTKKRKNKLQRNIGISLHWSREFIPNLILVVGAIFVWRGVWDLIDKYFLPAHEDLSFILSIIIGIFLIYLPDGSFKQLGDYEHDSK